MPNRLEPLRFKRHFVDKAWGGRSLEHCPGFELPAGRRIGETWEIVDRETENSIVASGPFAGRSLRELMREHGPAILGSAAPGKDGRFPLLVKYLDASKNLSVQVHPDAATARRMGKGAEGKTEAWYIVDAKPDSKLYVGLLPGLKRDEFARSAASDAVESKLNHFGVQRGECLLVRGGTVHAIGAGVTVLEVQENSDTTYRLYDWGNLGLDKKPRETHVEQALECIDFGAPAARPHVPLWRTAGEGFSRAVLASSDVFGMNALKFTRPVRLDPKGAFRIYAVLGGAGELCVEGCDESWPLRVGDVWLIPAECGYHAALPDGDDELFLVEMTPPAH